MLHQLGSGTLGPVFRAEDPGTGRIVAVKAFKLDLIPEDAARLAASLDALVRTAGWHSGVAPALAAGLEGATPFLVSEFVPGDTLDVVLRGQAPVPLETGLMLVAGVARALEAVWAAGWGHGLLHPRDVFVLADGQSVQLTGVGVARALADVGLKLPVRRPYTAPERLAGRDWDIRSDVFALAAIAHELLTGRRPVGTGEQDGTFARGIGPEDSASIRQVLATALAEEPEARFATAESFAAALADASRAGQMALPIGGPASLVNEQADRDVRELPDQAVWVVDRREVDEEPGAPSEVAPTLESTPARLSASQSTIEGPPARTWDGDRFSSDEPEGGPEAAGSSWPVHPAGPSATGRWAAMAVVALIGIAVGVGGLRFLLRSDPAPESGDLTEVELGVGESPAAGLDGVPPAGPLVPGDTDVPVTDVVEGTTGQPALPPPVAETETAPVRRATSQVGRLVVVSEPSGALLLVDGRLRGETPLTVSDLALGAHTVQVARPGYVPVTDEVTLTAGVPARTVSVTLRPGVDPSSVVDGRLLVDSRPRGARVLVDGRFVGVTPVRLAAIAPGRHAVRIELSGYRTVATSVDIGGGQPSRVAVTLEPAGRQAGRQ